MTELLRLDFEKGKKEHWEEQYITFSSSSRDFDTITLFDFVEVKYHGSSTYLMNNYELNIIFKFDFLDMLKSALQGELILDDSINNYLGYLNTQYYRKNIRKNFKYDSSKEGNLFWVGHRYQLCDAPGYIAQTSWIYNDKSGNVWFELSPSYPWQFMAPCPGETFIKYSQWLKEFRPYVVRQISREVAQDWVKKLEKLLKTVEANDKRLSCTGPGCKLCKQEGSEVYKQFCGDCKDCEKIHNES